MPSIPLIGGPHDGGKIKPTFWPLSPEIHFPTVLVSPDQILGTWINDYYASRFPHLHTYRLSKCGSRYLHESIVGEG